MIKRLWLFSLILLYCATAKAQFTSVTATVTDLDSQTWNNGSWSVSLYNQYPQSPANINGTPLTPSQLNQSGAINGSGALSLTLADNSIVAPSGTYWVFIICPNASAQCAVVSTPVSGASQSISSVLSANLKGPRFSANSQSGGAWGYLDSEIYPKPNPGGQYYNVSTGCQKVWSGSAWSCLGAGVGFALQVNGVAVTSPVNFANSASVSFTNPSGSLINAISTVAIGCNPSGSSGNILLDNGSHGCTDAPINYNSGTGAYTATIAGAATVSAASYSSTVTGIFSVTAGGLIQASNAGISFTDNSSANISIHEQGTSPINITADLGAVNLTGTSVNANGSPVCTTASGCNSSLSRTCNANGCYVQLIDGTIIAWGTVNVSFTSSTLANRAFSYPISFTTSPSVVTNANSQPDGSDDSLLTYIKNPSTSGATIVMRCPTNIGGSGCPNNSNTVPVSWHAIGF